MLLQSYALKHVPFDERRFQLLRHRTDIDEETFLRKSRANDEFWKALETSYRAQLSNNTNLLAKVLPSYPPVCTRLLVDNGWVALLQRDNVDLVASRASHFQNQSTLVAADGTQVSDLDVVIWATGFQSTKFCLPALTVVNADGRSLADAWGTTPVAFLGMTVPDFPNFVMTYGPNTNVGSGGSICWVAENQARYITQACGAILRHNWKIFEVTKAACDDYNTKVDHALRRTVWADPGCASWYKDGSTGKVVNNSPWSLEHYSGLLRRLDLQHFHVQSQQELRPL